MPTLTFWNELGNVFATDGIKHMSSMRRMAAIACSALFLQYAHVLLGEPCNLHLTPSRQRQWLFPALEPAVLSLAMEGSHRVLELAVSWTHIGKTFLRTGVDERALILKARMESFSSHQVFLRVLFVRFSPLCWSWTNAPACLQIGQANNSYWKHDSCDKKTLFCCR